MSSPTPRGRVRKQSITIFLVSAAGLLLEVSYTRIVSFKLWYYYTYLVLGLALLGIGAGAVLVAISKRLKEASTERILSTCGGVGAGAIMGSFFVIARLPIDTVKIWDYGTRSSFKNLAALGLIAFLLFVSFMPFGVMIAIILGRAEKIGRLYFADLVGAGLGCVVAIPLIANFGPPVVVMIAASMFAVAGIVAAPPSPRPYRVANAVIGLIALVAAGANNWLPQIRPEEWKVQATQDSEYSAWGPVFRVDVVGTGHLDDRLLAHDATFGSGIHEYHGDPTTLSRFDSDPRALPFALLGKPSEHTLIIGSAGGNEILASLYYKTKKIEGVELNPVTIDMLENKYRDFTGNILHQPGVTVYNDDGRSFIARSNDSYDLVWYVAPDSYAANNAASSGAFVLSESYLYTSDMIRSTLEHLDDNGIMVAQFGEFDFENRPNRTSRYVATARAALEKAGVSDPSRHIMVAAKLTKDESNLSTIIIKKTPFTAAEVQRVQAAVPGVPDARLAYAPGVQPRGTAAEIAAAPTKRAADQIIESSNHEIGEVTDDGPFFWHFNSFSAVAADIFRPLGSFDPEQVIGERVLLLLLGIATAFAAVFLLLPFVRLRSRWAAMPAKGTSGLYFSALGLGFMMLEVSLIQKLTLLLGYPTYSLTVTIASILVAAGFGALLSDRLAKPGPKVMWLVVACLAGLVTLYQFGLGPITVALLPASLGIRVAVTVLMLIPLGLCLGMFMPLGLGQVARLGGENHQDYVAWSWAINGFFSVIGSVATTILSMIFGFRTVMFLALGIYGVAALAFQFLARHKPIELTDSDQESIDLVGDHEISVAINA